MILFSFFPVNIRIESQSSFSPSYDPDHSLHIRYQTRKTSRGVFMIAKFGCRFYSPHLERRSRDLGLLSCLKLFHIICELMISHFFPFFFAFQDFLILNIKYQTLPTSESPACFVFKRKSLFFNWLCVILVINPKLQHPSSLPFDISSGEWLRPLEKQRELPNISDTSAK